MPKKIDNDKTHAQKVISLFAKLLFSGRKYSLTELSTMLNCSKQTVQRLVDHINTSYSIVINEEILNSRKYYSIESPKDLPVLGLSENEYRSLLMCKAFTQHLLGNELFDEATIALEKSRALINSPKGPIPDHFAVFRSGSIDYTPHQVTIKTIIDAMEQRRICKLVYHSPDRQSPKTFYIKPLKLFSYDDALYLHARKAIMPGEKYQRPKYDPLLVVHRIQTIELTNSKYEFPTDYDFDKAFNQSFGVIDAEKFDVEVIFTDFAALLVAERTWSPDQQIEKMEDGSIRLRFTASSIPEVISWVLSYDKDATVVKPDWLRTRIKDLINKMGENYRL